MNPWPAPSVQTSNPPLGGFLDAGRFFGTIVEGGVGGNTEIDVVIQAVPEPNALTMLAGSIGMALGLQRFRRRRSRS